MGVISFNGMWSLKKPDFLVNQEIWQQKKNKGITLSL